MPICFCSNALAQWTGIPMRVILGVSDRHLIGMELVWNSVLFGYLTTHKESSILSEFCLNYDYDFKEKNS